MRGLSLLPFCGLAALFSCSPRTAVTPSEGHNLEPAPAEHAEAGSSEPVFGGPLSFGRVAIYPITLAAQEDVGPVITLEAALETGVAEVREVGAARGGDANELNQPNVRQMNQVQQVGGGDGATVNTLVIENRGEVPVFVLAGTVVRGGKQDRQIGQDFIVQAKQSLSVDAFCVEQGRWTATREGALTGGRFSTAPILANSNVRAAAQYKKDQGEVWAEVSATNKRTGKKAESDTLFATLDDAEVGAAVERLAKRIDAALGAVTPTEHLVGMAWAIDGKAVGVRWFAHRRLFELARDSLIRTAAVDAVTARMANPTASVAKWPAAAEITKTIAEVEAQREVEHRATDGANDNEYRESERAWGSKTLLKGGKGKARAVAHDYLMK